MRQDFEGRIGPRIASCERGHISVSPKRGASSILSVQGTGCGTDTATASSLLDVMETLHHELKTTFFFSTHDPRVMERAHRLIQLRDGRIERDEPLVPRG